MKGDKDIINILISHDADINRPDDKYISALHQAVANNAMEIVEYLANYISVDEQDINEKTPLHYAYEYENEKWREPKHKRRNESHSFVLQKIEMIQLL